MRCSLTHLLTAAAERAQSLLGCDHRLGKETKESLTGAGNGRALHMNSS